jgi:mRNA-degrading endonuclease RelE of RelBE toxin-antitoxin system
VAKELEFTQTFKENYHRLPENLQSLFDKKLALFLENPRHPSLNVHRYHGRENVWEAYVNQKYRFTFSVTGESIIFRNIGPHSIVDKGKV